MLLVLSLFIFLNHILAIKKNYFRLLVRSPFVSLNDLSSYFIVFIYLFLKLFFLFFQHRTPFFISHLLHLFKINYGRFFLLSSFLLFCFFLLLTHKTISNSHMLHLFSQKYRGFFLLSSFLFFCFFSTFHTYHHFNFSHATPSPNKPLGDSSYSHHFSVFFFFFFFFFLFLLLTQNTSFISHMLDFLHSGLSMFALLLFLNHFFLLKINHWRLLVFSLFISLRHFILVFYLLTSSFLFLHFFPHF